MNTLADIWHPMKREFSNLAPTRHSELGPKQVAKQAYRLSATMTTSCLKNPLPPPQKKNKRETIKENTSLYDPKEEYFCRVLQQVVDQGTFSSATAGAPS